MTPADLGVYMIAAIVAMSISMAIIPLMIKLAPVIGMVDAPNERKVHSEMIPRVGGIGIIIGFIIPVLMWVTPDAFTQSLIFGCVVLLLFGALDDAKELGPVIKFVGQFLAAIALVYYGDVYVRHLPFFGLEQIDAVFGMPFTVIAIVGVINALNLSDGLDGLAGGEALLSLIAILYLGIQFEASTTVLIAAASIGGIFGFLRYNSHPARVFMGDSGSQTIGFILAALALYLTQNVNSVVSPALPALLVGLPVLDALVVFYIRARKGSSLVVASKDHLHHRLLGLGFYHYESVIIIYSVQMLFVLIAVMMPYESDVTILSIYILVGLVLFAAVSISEKLSWRVHEFAAGDRLNLVSMIKSHERIRKLPYHILEAGLSLFLVASALMTTAVPIDFGVSSAVMLSLLALPVIVGIRSVLLYRLILFVTIGFAVYLLSTYTPQWLIEESRLAFIYFTLMAVVSFISVRLSEEGRFQTTPFDYLVVAIALVIGLLAGQDPDASTLVWMGVQIIILFYLAELLITRMKGFYNRITGALAVTLVLLASRAFL